MGNLRSPDLVSLEEVQDDNGPANDATTDATLTYRALIAAIRLAGGPEYDFRQIDPVDDQDGGEPGGNIRVGFLFRTDRGLSFVDRPGGTPTTSTEVLGAGNGARLSASPGRIDPTNPAFNNSRKPLAGEFRFRGRTVFAIANHFNSKGGDDPLFGRFQPPQRQLGGAAPPAGGDRQRFVGDILAADKQAERRSSSETSTTSSSPRRSTSSRAASCSTWWRRSRSPSATPTCSRATRRRSTTSS